MAFQNHIQTHTDINMINAGTEIANLVDESASSLNEDRRISKRIESQKKEILKIIDTPKSKSSSDTESSDNDDNNKRVSHKFTESTDNDDNDKRVSHKFTDSSDEIIENQLTIEFGKVTDSNVIQTDDDTDEEMADGTDEDSDSKELAVVRTSKLRLISDVPLVKLDWPPPVKSKISSVDFVNYFIDEKGQKQKNYKCHTCGKTANCHKAILGHYRTHTGEKPYQELFENTNEIHLYYVTLIRL